MTSAPRAPKKNLAIMEREARENREPQALQASKTEGDMKKNSEDGQSSQSSLAESWSDLGSNSLEQACPLTRVPSQRCPTRT